MKIVYAANIRLPTEKAHGLQIMKTCEAFAHAGAEVELVVPRRRNDITGDAFTYYGVEKNFEVRYLPTIDTVRFGRAGFLMQAFLFALNMHVYCRTIKTNVLFSRDEMVLWFARSPRIRTVWESHTGAWNFFAKKVAHSCSLLVSISAGSRDFYVQHGIAKEKCIVAPDGVDLAAFAHPVSKEEARKRLGLPQKAKVALYAGRLDGWKGAGVLCEAAKYLEDVTVALIGGEKEQVAVMQAQYPKVIFLGYHPYRGLADNQAAADVLVLPNTAKDQVSAHLTSPLKLFTYMAAGKPIVASDLPSIREVLSEDSCYFITPDDPLALAQGIEKSLADGDQAMQKTARARALVEGYTWDARAKTIIDNL